MRNIQKGAVMHGTIELDGISKAYREPVIDHLDLSVDGGVFALLGPNGAGKTTLVSILTTLVRPDQGRARLGGIDVVGDPQGARRRFAATGQETTLDDLLTGRENLIMLGRLLGMGRASDLRADACIGTFDLARSEEHTSELQSRGHLVCRLLI